MLKNWNNNFIINDTEYDEQGILYLVINFFNSIYHI